MKTEPIKVGTKVKINGTPHHALKGVVVESNGSVASLFRLRQGLVPVHLHNFPHTKYWWFSANNLLSIGFSIIQKQMKPKIQTSKAQLDCPLCNVFMEPQGPGFCCPQCLSMFYPYRDTKPLSVETTPAQIKSYQRAAYVQVRLKELAQANNQDSG